MIWIIIYVIGYVVALIWVLIQHRKDYDTTILDLVMTIFTSLLSWVVIIIYYAHYIEWLRKPLWRMKQKPIINTYT